MLMKNKNVWQTNNGNILWRWHLFSYNQLKDSKWEQNRNSKRDFFARIGLIKFIISTKN